MIKTNGDLLLVLDSLFKNEESRWNNFFSELKDDHPLASEFPDESLVSFLKEHNLCSGKALDIGCGNGRNSLYLLESGFQVDAIDLSVEGIELARKKTDRVNFNNISLFDYECDAESYDLIYDAGLLHHIFPHRRPEYLQFLLKSLRPGGHFGLVAFNEKMGTAVSDLEIYKSRNMEGGMSYPKDKLLALLGEDFDLLEYRPMKNCKKEEELFGHDFVSSSLWRKKISKSACVSYA